VVRGADGARHIVVPLRGIKQLRLRITDGEDGLDYDTSVLGDPYLIDASGGRSSLTKLTPQLAVQNSGTPEYNMPNQSSGKNRFETSILTHPFATFIYNIPAGSESLDLWVGIESRTEKRGSSRFIFTGEVSGVKSSKASKPEGKTR